MSEEEIIFKNEYLQKPISFLTQENLEKLEQHCEKTIRYATRNLLKEHQIILELIDRYKEMNKEIRNLKEKNKELIQGQVKTLDEILQPELLKKYISKDKIREKIKECEEAMNKVKQFNPSTYAGIDTFIYAMAQRNILKSLLEEE